MAKKGIHGEQTYRGRWKGNTEAHITNPKVRENWDNIKWGQEYFWCDACKKYIDGSKEDGCPYCKGEKEYEKQSY